ncbi:MAG: polysaccharide deacetylase family protein [Planctomycetes bacterium]|nr:polysaccharide deacetylase family protein [Planctomycetota bacterium]MBL7007986.1 polysaccharide deacetylase family protein [Planctomycetota bacterium]
MHQRLCLGGVPILTFHSVRRRHTEALGPGGELTLPDHVFERLLRGLRRQGYHAIRCAELCSHLRDGTPLPSRPVLLTFDDGYLDNWTLVAPLLRRFGFCGAVFVATDFLHPEADAVRPTLDELAEPPERGYLSAAELRLLDQQGVLEVQSHTASHGRLPVSPQVLDFHRPDERCWWLERARATPNQMSGEESGATEGLVPWGAPVYRSEWASAARAMVPDPRLERELCAVVVRGGGPGFFDRPDWRPRLEEVVAADGWRHQDETEQARHDRILEDLGGAKRTLEGLLGHEVPYFAWPGGGSSAAAVRIAIDELGYRATFGTNRVCEGVPWDLETIPRAYFRQNYRGRGDAWLRAWHALGLTGWEAGRWSGAARLFVANRCMRLLADPAAPNGRRR